LTRHGEIPTCPVFRSVERAIVPIKRKGRSRHKPTGRDRNPRGVELNKAPGALETSHEEAARGFAFSGDPGRDPLIGPGAEYLADLL
jgi:hypothetical protein